MKINPKTFFEHYIVNPLADDLSIGERVLAMTLAIILFPATLVKICDNKRQAWILNKKVQNLNERQARLTQLSSSIEKINFTTLHSHRSLVDLPLHTLGAIINDKFINPFYSQQLPEKDDVKIPFVDNTGKIEWKLWSSLSRTEKIQVCNTYTQTTKISEKSSEAAVDKWFFAHGQAAYIEGDPREIQGNDHCCRSAIFAGIFAYLYEKYHPDHQVSVQDIALSQLVAAGHDAGRQTEGPNAYNIVSSAITKNELQSLGIQDPLILKESDEAIECRDIPPNGRKSLIAKCVQNANSAEYARLILKSPRQEKTEFDKARTYLDIFKELEEMAKQKNPSNLHNCVLKGDQTFGMFCYELDVLREEMNDFIYQTNQRDFREQAVKSGNYYSAVLNTINSVQFPILNALLTKTGIKEKPLSVNEIQQKQTIYNVKEWQQFGFTKISSASLQNLLNSLSSYSDSDARTMYKQIKDELERRLIANKQYEVSISQIPINISSMLVAYAHLSNEMKQLNQENFFQILSDFSQEKQVTLHNTVHFLIQQASDDLKGTYQAILLDILHRDLKTKLLQTQNLGIFKIEHAVALKEETENLLKIYRLADTNLRNEGAQTTAALALEQAAQIFARLHQSQLAKETLELAAKEIILDSSNPFYNLEKLFQDKSEEAFMYLPSDCGFLRKRKMRISQKNIEDSNTTSGTQRYVEMSLELTAISRQRLDNMLKLIDKQNKKLVPALYYRKEGKKYLAHEAMDIGKDLQLEIAPGVEIVVGNNKKYWNQYHLLRIKVKEGTSSQTVQRALAQMGLPMALLPSRPEDMANETLARSLAFRFPYLVANNKQLNATALYAKLNARQRKVIDNDLAKFKTTLVNHDHYEMVQPEIAQEAWKAGVRAVGSFIWGGAQMSQTAEVLKKILKKGMLSSEERYQNGILKLGCAPKFNYATGSGNQVFGRILTKNLFEENFALKNFPISGQIFLLLDTQVLERMPYSYAHDRGGVRNPNYYLAYHHAEKQEPIINFRGHEKIKEREGFIDHVEKLNKDSYPLNETMFDLNVGAKYIHKIVVWNEADRYTLIAILQKDGIHHIGDVPLEQAIVVAKELRPDLIDHFDQDENPAYKEVKNGRGTDYI